MLTQGAPDFTRDVKELRRQGDLRELLNHPDGYKISLPADLTLDFHYSAAFVRASRPDLDIKISREWSPYPDMEMYFKDYLDRYVANESYRKQNEITLLEDRWININGFRTRIISVARKPAAGSPETQNQYTFAYLITEGQQFYNFFFRMRDWHKQQGEVMNVLQSFGRMPTQGKAVSSLDFKPVLPNWNTETAAYYQKFATGHEFQWGIFTPWAVTKDYSRVASMEKSLNYHFPLILHYLFLGQDFPTAGMQQTYQRGQTVELTMQVASGDNDGKPRPNGNFAVLDGQRDQEIRAFAKQAKAFGHPFFFRLNNEMNSDWTQYSGLVTLSDADVYVKVWQRIYRIFAEEGVNNAIWIFNPHDISYPPVQWNDQTAYYPGNAFVQVLGLTGYNHGDYFKPVTGEHWRSFREVYDPMVAQYRSLYGKFPWVITEFASSSVGGDKAGWIRDMFATLPNYPEIKGAVWWSYFDPDYRPGNENIPARRYWLDEEPKYLQAFKDGLAAGHR